MRRYAVCLAVLVSGCERQRDHEVQAARCHLLLSFDGTRADSLRTLLSKEDRYHYDCAAWLAKEGK